MQRVFGGVGNIAVVADATGGQLHIDFNGQGAHAHYAARGLFGVVFLLVGHDMAGQGDDAIFGFHADVFGVDRGFPVEFSQHVLLELEIGFHGFPWVVGGGGKIRRFSSGSAGRAWWR